MRTDLFAAANTGNVRDYSSVRVIVPTFEHAKLFQQALGEHIGENFVPPRVSTLFALLGLQAPASDHVKVSATSERLMNLFGALREHAWIKKLFGANNDTDLLPLAQALLDLSDELTQAFLPIHAQPEVVRERWVTALAQLSAPVRQIISDEAQLVWTIWQSQLDQGDPGIQAFEKLMHIAAQATEPLIWISPSAPNPVETRFLQAYQQRQAIWVARLDWHTSSLPALFSSVWPELPELEEGASSAFVHAEPGKPPLNGMDNLQLLAAISVEDEAQKVAQTVVQYLQSGKTTLAIIAQDRVVARRIRALLERARVFVADETGWKLSTTRAASLLMTWYDVVSTRADTFVLLDLLKSPFVMPLTSMMATMANTKDNPDSQPPELQREGTDGEDGAFLTPTNKEDLVMQIELALRRANVLGGWEAILAALEAHPQAHGWVRRLALYAKKYRGTKTLSEWCAGNQQMLLELGWQQTLEQDDAGRQVLQMMQGIERDCDSVSGQFSFAEWRGLVSLQFERTPFIAPPNDRRVVMLPLNGAHLRSFDAVFVVGADAAHLPSRPQETLFFSNAVRRECGLVTNQERRQQQLRDFVELLLINHQVIVSWQAQRDGEENPVSPWLAQLGLGLEQAGLPPFPAHEIALERQHASSKIMTQPQPRAAQLAPTTLSSSGYASLRACPYQFFAGRMLRLSAMDELSDLPEKRDYGDWLHAILKTFHDELLQHPDLPDVERQAGLTHISEQLFSRVLKKTPAALGYKVRWSKVIPAYIAWLRERENQGWQFVMGEVWQERQIAWESGAITLRGRIDRIDRKDEAGGNRMAVLDYKTKTVTSLKARLKNGEDHQLPFYGLLAGGEHDEKNHINSIDSASYVALELDKKNINHVEANAFEEWVHALEQAIIGDMQAIQSDVALPAHGAESACQYCEMRGLCRKGAWQ